MAIAIDFGTSNTVVARWNSVLETAETLTIPGISQQVGKNLPLIPSLAYVKNARTGEVMIGQTVRDRGYDLAQDPRFFRNFKRGVGAPIQGFLPQLDDTNITFEAVGKWFLDEVLSSLTTQEQTVPDSLVLTVPVDSFETYRLWLTQVSQAWPIDKVRMLDEPTAAALGYGTGERDVLLVLDFGGGTVDLSLVQLDLGMSKIPQGFIVKWGGKFFGDNTKQRPRIARVLAKAGKNLGGSDLDQWLVDYFAQTQGLPKSPLTIRLAERLKIRLSTQRKATEVYFNDQTLDSYELKLDRDGWEAILQERQFFEQLDELMTQVLQQGRRNGIKPSDIDAVLLVGGTVQMPAVQRWIKGYFDEKVIRCDRPFDAIASGALQMAQGFQLKDFLYHSYGVRYWNRRNKRHDWHPIIRTGQAYPMADPVELKLGASAEQQPSIELIVGELGQETGGTEVFLEGDCLVTRAVTMGERKVQPLNDREGARTIAQLSPPGNPGSDRISLAFWVDDERFLRLSVTDLLTDKRLVQDQLVAQLS